MSLTTLRVLLVDADARQSQVISSRLADANHTVLPACGLEEACEALFNQKFDAVVLGSPLPADGVAAFTGKLRSLEMNQRAFSRTAILSLSPDVCDGSAWQPSAEMGIDGYLSERFEANALMAAVMSLANVICPPTDMGESPESESLPIFEPEKLKSQVAYDRELLIEIIDLFLSEQLTQIAEMQEALANGNFDHVYLVAHTIKGSLGSLYAPVARLRAEALESAAKSRNHPHCEHFISVLKRDLETLQPALLHLRDSSSPV